MVWIHGGGNVLGEGLQTDGGTSGTKLADTEDVVVVSMNYRFGPFGFLAHEALSEEGEHGASGNYGLMDQVAALRWVRENIEGFGGDPDNITIFGESAGGLNTCALVMSPQAEGLFHRAIMQSGTCYRPWPTLPSAHAHGERFAELAGCDNESDVLACLRAKPWKELHDAWAPDPAEALETARGLLDRVGLAGRRDHYPAQLSGGEQQRVAIARALANRPKVLLADEPTGNLDPHTAEAVFDSLLHLVREEGLAAIIATHNAELANRFDRLVHLQDGQLVEI